MIIPLITFIYSLDPYILIYVFISLFIISKSKNITSNIETHRAISVLTTDLERHSADFYILNVSDTDLVKQVIKEADDNIYGNIDKHLASAAKISSHDRKPIVFSLVSKKGSRRINVPAASYHVLGVLNAIIVYRHRPGPVTANTAFELAHEVAHTRISGQMATMIGSFKSNAILGYLCLIPITSEIGTYWVFACMIFHLWAFRMISFDEIVSDRFAFYFIGKRFPYEDWSRVLFSKISGLKSDRSEFNLYRRQRIRGLTKIVRDVSKDGEKHGRLNDTLDYKGWLMRKMNISILSFCAISLATSILLIWSGWFISVSLLNIAIASFFAAILYFISKGSGAIDSMMARDLEKVFNIQKSSEKSFLED